jgi:hypothetical protein
MSLDALLAADHCQVGLVREKLRWLKMLCRTTFLQACFLRGGLPFLEVLVYGCLSTSVADEQLPYGE